MVVPVIDVFVAETRSFHRGRFALAGSTLLLLGVAFLALVAGTGDAYRAEFLVPVYAFLPTIFIPITATSFARARADGFVDAVLTAPVTKSEYVTGKLAANFASGLLLLAATTPFAWIQAWHLGFVGLTWKYVLLGVCVLGYACLLGLVVGLCFTGRATVPALTASIALMLMQVVAYVFLQAALTLPPTASREALVGLLHVSGVVLLHDVFRMSEPVQATTPWQALAALVLHVAVLGLFARWMLRRGQSADRWERRAHGMMYATIAFALVLLIPVAVAHPDYKAADPEHERGGHSNMMVVRLLEEAQQVQPERFPLPPVLDAGTPNHRVLWLFLPEQPSASQPFRDVEVTLVAHNMVVHPTHVLIREPGTLPRAAPDEAGRSLPAIKIPLVLTTPPASTLRENWHHLDIDVRYNATGAERTLTADARLEVASEVPSVTNHVAIAVAAPPGICLGAFAARKWRMR